MTLSTEMKEVYAQLKETVNNADEEKDEILSIDSDNHLFLEDGIGTYSMQALLTATKTSRTWPKTETV